MTTRDDYLAAGLKPQLFHFWYGCSTESLRDTLNELEAKAEELADPDWLAEVRDKLALELDFRGDDNDCPGFHRAVNGQTVCGYCGKALTR